MVVTLRLRWLLGSVPCLGPCGTPFWFCEGQLTRPVVVAMKPQISVLIFTATEFAPPALPVLFHNGLFHSRRDQKVVTLEEWLVTLVLLADFVALQYFQGHLSLDLLAESFQAVDRNGGRALELFQFEKTPVLVDGQLAILRPNVSPILHKSDSTFDLEVGQVLVKGQESLYSLFQASKNSVDLLRVRKLAIHLQITVDAAA